jgi:hypothetical protein
MEAGRATMDVPPGWEVVGDRVREIRTPNGYLSRGEQLTGRCRSPECSRTVRVDLLRLKSLGFGDNDMVEVQKTYRCQAGRCDLDFHSTYPEGVPLQTFVGTEVKILVRCGSTTCDVSRVYEPLQLIGMLQRKGTGDGNTSVLKVHTKVRGKCPRCGLVYWKSELLKPRAPHSGPANG